MALKDTVDIESSDSVKKKTVPSNVHTKKAEKQVTEDANVDPTEKMNEEMASVEVPMSIAMNQFRQGITSLISNSPLHIECILEIMRSALTSVESAAFQNASAEENTYREKLTKIQEKYTKK